MGLSYNSEHDELYIADRKNHVVRSMRLGDNSLDLRDVYRGTAHDRTPFVYSVCYMGDSGTLLVCSGEVWELRSDQWLVAFSRVENEWRETHRVLTDGMGWICCPLSDSRVLVGECDSMYMELFRVQSGPCIARISRIHVPEEYKRFSATNGSDTLVAMSYMVDQSVRVYRMCDGDRLEELANIRLMSPCALLWLDDHFLIAAQDLYPNAIIELELSGTQLKHCDKLLDCKVERWCEVKNGFAIVECQSGDILQYTNKLNKE